MLTYNEMSFISKLSIYLSTLKLYKLYNFPNAILVLRKYLLQAYTVKTQISVDNKERSPRFGGIDSHEFLLVHFSGGPLISCKNGSLVNIVKQGLKFPLNVLEATN